MNSSEHPADDLARRDQIADLWDKVLELKRERYYRSLPERCRESCSIAKFIIGQYLNNGIPDAGLELSSFSECVEGPEITGRCAKKTLCHHPGSGESTNFMEQVGMLTSHVAAETDTRH